MKCAWTALLLMCCEHLGVGAKTQAEHDIVSGGSHPLSLPSVPPMQFAGSDGLPELPMVKALADSFLKADSSTKSETSALAAKLKVNREKEVEKLEHLKSAYDRKLKSQEKENQHIAKTNADLARETVGLNRAIDQLNARIKVLYHWIKTRRQQLQALEKRFLSGGQFMKDALARLDDAKEMGLLVMDWTSHAPESFPKRSNDTQRLGEADEDDNAATKDFEGEADGAVTFRSLLNETSTTSTTSEEAVPEALAVRRVAPALAKGTKNTSKEAVPEAVAVRWVAPALAKGADGATEDDSMLEMLKKSLHRWRDASKKSEEAMQAKFQEEFKAGAARQKALYNQLTVLQGVVKKLKTKSSQLQQAEATLKAKLAGVEKKLQQGGALASKLSTAASARIDESQ